MPYSKINRKKLHACWRGIRHRCGNEKYQQYHYYGGRGIKICEEWKNNFENFYKWAIEKGWEPHLVIDRIDNDGGYSPNNCRFVTVGDSLRNKRLLPRHNTSGYRGVAWRAGKWEAHIWYNDKGHHLGRFDSKILAALRFDAEAYLLNDGRPMNFLSR